MWAINVINNCVPAERSCYINMKDFAIQDWDDAKDIIMRHIPDVVSIPDGLTKALGWVIHSCHTL